MSSVNKLVFSAVLIGSILLVSFSAQQFGDARKMCRGKRSVKDPGSMMHSHLARKVFDRACAASKDVIDEIALCLSNNTYIRKHMTSDAAAECHKAAFGVEFDPMDVAKHKDEICKNRDKFEDMIACGYKKFTENTTPKEIEEASEAMIDVGLCVVNALDA